MPSVCHITYYCVHNVEFHSMEDIIVDNSHKEKIYFQIRENLPLRMRRWKVAFVIDQSNQNLMKVNCNEFQQNLKGALKFF